MRVLPRLMCMLPLGLALTLAAGCGKESVDPAAAQSLAGCESPSGQALAAGPLMLPGNACLNCHKQGGQASEGDVRWSVAGTVFGSATAACSTGLSGVTVEILRQDGSVQLTLTTNETGNFYASSAVTLPLRARVKKGTMVREMAGIQQSGNCASCHSNPGTGGAPGRIFLN